jgi:stress response protein YsnF
MVLTREELVQLPSEWMATERLRVRRRIVSETITVPVVVRREELVMDSLPVTGAASPAEQPSAPLVIVLREEVPVVTFDVRPYERVTVSVVLIAEQQDITAELGSERLEVLTDEISER